MTLVSFLLSLKMVNAFSLQSVLFPRPHKDWANKPNRNYFLFLFYGGTIHWILHNFKICNLIKPLEKLGVHAEKHQIVVELGCFFKEQHLELKSSGINIIYTFYRYLVVEINLQFRDLHIFQTIIFKKIN
ncbi:hypothetical protein clem_02415 [Legionella clemsonensis]|uniref:Uncharacterized protein n=1 Tax=Legionella clemsonensis TaxID=1867846 RepID=A0A222NZS9_9GAMM|nr:hypothetical protein clem_02415 [Legionella clemsonensis]